MLVQFLNLKALSWGSLIILPLENEWIRLHFHIDDDNLDTQQLQQQHFDDGAGNPSG